MKFAVTGALGHIGSALIRYLPEVFPECEILLIDNLSTERYASLFNLPKTASYSFHHEDILNDHFEKLLEGVDAVIHLAAMTDAEASVKSQDLVQKVNVFGTERVARACAKYGCSLIFPSTTSVYGDHSGEVSETSDLSPTNPYSISKALAEERLKEIAESSNLNYVICRLGTIFGPSIGMRFHTAVSKFCWQAVMKKPLTVWRTAWDQKRPYLDLQDALRAFSFILKQEIFDGKVYNLVTANSSASEVVHHIQKEVPDLSYDLVDSDIMGTSSYHVLNDKFKSYGFEFKGSLSHGIAETIDILKNSSTLTEQSILS